MDFYLAGHYHEYESLWPSVGGVPTQQNFSEPRAPIHITAGNGGAPGPDHFSSVVNHTLVNHTKLPASRRRLDGGNATANGYARAWARASTRILGRRTAPVSSFLIPNPAWCYPKILVLGAGDTRPRGLQFECLIIIKALKPLC